MATLDLTRATQGVDMQDNDLVAFDTVNSAFATQWSWTTPDGHDIDLGGTGLTYDANGRALTGTVTSIAIDLGNNNFSDPDIFVTGINADAKQLDNSAADFWSFLSGDDTFLGPLLENGGTGFSALFGDAFRAPAKAAAGGDDLFRAGDTSIQVAGDVFDVNTGAAFTGGDDRIFGAPTEQSQGLSGDAFTVQGTGVLIGGDDIMAIRAVNTSSFAFGDATTVHGFGGLAKVAGGDDKITAEDGSAAPLSGDVGTVVRQALITGGADTINGSERGEAITGDVFQTLSGLDITITGGADTLDGRGGNDIISGDVHVSENGVVITGGDDTINGGEGADRIFGEIAVGDASSVGGDDDLFGDAGDDEIFGQTGNDLLDGGSGADRLVGGVGNDTYVVDDIGDIIAERSGEGFDTVNTALANFKLGDNVERVNSTGIGNFVGIGNALDNRFQALDGNDRFVDIAGGADIFSGGGGTDTVDFRASATGAVLNFLAGVHAGAAAGDSYSSIEKFLGSDGAKDTMIAGGTGRFVFAGFGGNDVLTGGVKNDQLLGGEGNDTLAGGGDRDSLDGGAGTDRLDGGTGNDVLTGGLGADTFIFAHGSGVDRITDYDDAADLIDLTSFGFSNFNQVKALATEAADGSLIIDFGNGDKLDIDNFRLANFDAGDVLI